MNLNLLTILILQRTNKNLKGMSCCDNFFLVSAILLRGWGGRGRDSCLDLLGIKQALIIFCLFSTLFPL